MLVARSLRRCEVGLALGFATALIPAAQSTPAGELAIPWTYQAQLLDNGGPPTGSYDVRFQLYAAPSAGTAIDAPTEHTGLFPPVDDWIIVRDERPSLIDILCQVAQPWPPDSVGDWPASWNPVYLEVGVRRSGEPDYTVLAPRQELTPAPLAISAVVAGRADSLRLPFSVDAATTGAMLELAQQGSDPALRVALTPHPDDPGTPPWPWPFPFPPPPWNLADFPTALDVFSPFTGELGLKVIHSGAGPAAHFEVLPHPEAPAALPAVQIKSGAAAPSLEVSNDGGGSAARLEVGPSTLAGFPGMELTMRSAGPALRAVVDAPDTTGATPAGEFEIVDAMNSSPALYAATAGSGPAALLDGDVQVAGELTVDSEVHVTGDLTVDSEVHVTGDLTVDSAVHVAGALTQEYAAGTANRATPIAYGFINSDGTVASGTPNISASWDLANNRYLIAIAGETYASHLYAAAVTPRVTGTSPPRLVSTSAVGGELIVRAYDLAGATVQNAFQFVVYKP